MLRYVSENKLGKKNIEKKGTLVMKNETPLVTETVPGWYINFLAAVIKQLPRPGQIDQVTAEGWEENQQSLKETLAGCLLPPGFKELAGKQAQETPLVDSVVRVDRSIRPSYPEWVKTVMHPELENTGPAEYDITKTEQWLHDGQKDGKWIEGNKIYAHLKDTGDLKNHCGLRDLEEIQKKGIAFFRKHFAGKAVFAWQGIVRYRDGDLRVPYLCEIGGRVVLRWLYLGSDWLSCRSPGLRHAS